MKKILLAASVIASALVANAQVADPDCATGKSMGSAFDDFSTATEYGDSTGGMFWFGEAKPNGFDATLTRNSAESKLDVIIDQPFNQFEPIGMSFGDDNGADPGGVPFMTDFSLDGSYEMSVTNNDADSTIKVRLAIQDADGNLADSKPAGDLSSMPWMHEIAIVLAPGETKELSGTFIGSGQSIYGDLAKCTAGGVTASDCIIQTIDLSKVTTALVTVVNNNQNASFQQLALAGHSVSINYLKLGACEVVGLVNDNADESLSVYPNPASNNVSFNSNLTNVTVYDAIGNVVTEKTNASELNVADFKSGIYFLNSSEGTTQFIVE